MKPAKKRRIEKFEEEDGADDNRHVPLSALAELTSSEVVAQLKNGMAHLAPLDEEEKDEPPY